MMDFQSYQGVSGAQHQTYLEELSSQGYRMISLSVYGDYSNPLYAAVWVKRQGAAWVAVHGVNEAGYKQFMSIWDSKGYAPVLLSATGPKEHAVFAAVLEEGIQGSWETHFGIPTGSVDTPGSFDYLNRSFHAKNFHIGSLAIYGAPDEHCYIAVWHANPGYVKWHVHPTGKTQSYQTTFDAETQLPGYGLHGYRPAFVALSSDQTYCSVFRDDFVGYWVARHGMTADEYQAQFDIQTSSGLYPICLQGGGTTANPVYAAIFAGQDIPSARQWTITGNSVPSLSKFDNLFQQFMQTNAVRAAQFSMSVNGNLLLSHAYTWAEPGYKITQPSDRFLLASCSKMFCEQAIQHLYETGKLDPPRLVFKQVENFLPEIGDVIKGNNSQATATITAVNGNTLTLTTVYKTFTVADDAATISSYKGPARGIIKVISYSPSTAVYPLLRFSDPADPRSDEITIQQLLDHSGGYDDRPAPDGTGFDPTYRMRCIAIAQNLNRPANKLDIAQYMYGQQLQHSPGEIYAYCNYGYLLLTLVVEHISKLPYFDYLKQYVLDPLNISEILLSSTEARFRAANEAICEDQGLGLSPIDLASDLLVPAVYGGDGQIKEVAAGCAGLAASAFAITQFIRAHQVWGNGPRSFFYKYYNNINNWNVSRSGSTPGTSSLGCSMENGINYAFIINTRDLPPQTKLTINNLPAMINNIINELPGHQPDNG